MANIIRKKEICPTCNGDKTILCCTCGDDNDCRTFICPTCRGKGFMVTYNKPVIFGVAVIGIMLLVGLVVSLL